MMLITKRKLNKAKGKARRIGRGTGKRRTNPGEGAGRPSLHPGKDISRHATIYMTEDGWNKLAVVQQELLRRNKDKVSLVSVSDAGEEAIHRLHNELTRAR